MARTRFIKDTGLTVRMTTAMFILGALFVGLVVLLMYAFQGTPLAVIIGLGAIGVAIFQWYRSDTVAMRAMGAREVTPEEAPQLHGIVDRLCALADMPKPKVAISPHSMPNAFATGRSPDRAVVCATEGILRKLDDEELEAVIAHELSHVAHRDVLVMTVASSAGILAGMLVQGGRFGAFAGRGRGNNNNAIGLVAVLVISLVVYAISFLLLRLLSRYRELSADRSAAYLTQKPSTLARALQKISGDIAHTPQRDLRAPKSMNAFFITPAVSGISFKTLTSTHPSLEQRLQQLAEVATALGRPMDGGPGALGDGSVGPLR